MLNRFCALLPLLTAVPAPAQTAGAHPAATAVAAPAAPADDTAALALKLANPVAALISLPLQTNFDGDIGPKVAGERQGERITLNIQPVIPIRLNSDWNMISRTILPVIGQTEVAGRGTNQFGLGDVVQSLFFSPTKPSPSGIIWGAGPVLLVPTATDSALGAGKWGAGPTAVVLKIAGPITFGALANHIWSFAGKDSRADVSATFVQPFFAYTTKTATTYSINTETAYDWKNDIWLVPINLGISQLVVLGKQPVSIGGGVRYWVESPAGGPDWGFRLSLSLLFPK
jgi:hypothetical protein